MKNKPRLKSFILVAALGAGVLMVNAYRDFPVVMVTTYLNEQPNAGNLPAEQDYEDIVPRHAVNAYVQRKLRDERRPDRLLACQIHLDGDAYLYHYSECDRPYGPHLLPSEHTDS